MEKVTSNNILLSSIGRVMEPWVGQVKPLDIIFFKRVLMKLSCKEMFFSYKINYAHRINKHTLGKFSINQVPI